MIHIHITDCIFKSANDMYQNLLIRVHIMKMKIRYADISWKKLIFYNLLQLLCVSLLDILFLDQQIFNNFIFLIQTQCIFFFFDQISFLCLFPFLRFFFQSKIVQNGKEKQVLHTTSTKWMQRQEDLIWSILKIYLFHCLYPLVSCLLVLAYHRMSVNI